MLSAKAYQKQEPGPERISEEKPADVHFIQNISVEEWDCPKPGAKHYLPKSIKENIRRNWKKFESDAKRKHQVDSVANR